MSRLRLKYGGRKKAPFGTQEAAILGAAAINAATQLTAAGINSKATKDAAKNQADAINQQAMRQAQAIKDQTAKAREYQQESQEFVKEQNAESRELQKDIQMTLQMMAGQQNVNDRLEASKIQVRNGGCAKRKLRSGGNATFPLRRSDNLPFTVTDGGGVMALGQTPEGYDLYEIYGNDHEHYHKAQGGKNKTGVGIKFADGNVIEGEGNQNGIRGEKMLVTPTNAYFISRHTLAGFNPSKAVDRGLHPELAYAIQEKIKAENGISDDGKNDSSPVERMMIGGDFINKLYNESIPQLANDTTGSTITGAAYVNNEKPKLRNGGKCRRKATGGISLYGNPWGFNPNGWGFKNFTLNYADDTTPYVLAPSDQIVANSSNGNVTTTNTNGNTNVNTNATRAGSGWGSPELWGAGITALGNLGGAWITSAANRSAAEMLSDAYSKSSSILAGAYGDVPLIDLNSIRKDTYSAAHAMPALQAPVSFVASRLAPINRQLQRRLTNAGKYSASSAAANDRMSKAEIDAQDQRNAAYSADQQQMQAIRQANADRITQAAMRNAELDTQANREFSDAYMKALMYNNEAERDAILGAAGATAEGIMGSANAMAQARTANAQAWSSALLGSTQGFTNSLNAMATRRANLAAALLGATTDSQASYYASIANRRDALNAYNSLKAEYNATTYPETKRILARQINTIASRRGFEIV